MGIVVLCYEMDNIPPPNIVFWYKYVLKSIVVCLLRHESLRTAHWLRWLLHFVRQADKG